MIPIRLKVKALITHICKISKSCDITCNSFHFTAVQPETLDARNCVEYWEHNKWTVEAEFDTCRYLLIGDTY